MNTYQGERITFGKYKWRLLTEVPIDYLMWLMSNKFFRARNPGMHRTISHVVFEHLKREFDPSPADCSDLV